jgi:hypothetical protein
MLRSTSERGVPTSEYNEAGRQVRGTAKGPHNNGAKEPKLYYFICAYQAAGLDLQLAGDMWELSECNRLRLSRSSMGVR